MVGWDGMGWVGGNRWRIPFMMIVSRCLGSKCDVCPIGTMMTSTGCEGMVMVGV